MITVSISELRFLSLVALKLDAVLTYHVLVSISELRFLSLVGRFKRRRVAISLSFNLRIEILIIGSP